MEERKIRGKETWRQGKLAITVLHQFQEGENLFTDHTLHMYDGGVQIFCKVLSSFKLLNQGKNTFLSQHTNTHVFQGCVCTRTHTHTHKKERERKPAKKQVI